MRPLRVVAFHQSFVRHYLQLLKHSGVLRELAFSDNVVHISHSARAPAPQHAQDLQLCVGRFEWFIPHVRSSYYDYYRRIGDMNAMSADLRLSMSCRLPARSIGRRIVLCFIPIGFGSVLVQGQSSNPFLAGRERGVVRVESSVRADPPTSSLTRFYAGSSRLRGITNGPTFYTRILLDRTNHAYLGYELLLEQQQTGRYRVTFGRLGVTPLDLAAGDLSTPPHNSPDPQKPTDLAWTSLPLPALPEPRVINEGETFSIVLLVDAATGARLIDDIKIDSSRPVRPGNVLQIPTVSGTARDFVVSDAELDIVQPRITLDRSVQSTWGPGLRNVHSSLVWLYLPEHGRFILSLLPRPALGFRRAGEVRGGVIAFTLSGHSVKVECMNPIAPGHAAYNLYVLHDQSWEPTAENQKHLPALGTVSAAELTALRGQ